MRKLFLLQTAIPYFIVAILITGCVHDIPVPNEETKYTNGLTVKNDIKSGQILKRKVAIARFSNEAQYGKSTLFGVSYNIEKQATDILSAKLTQSDKFIMLERSDINQITIELERQNLKSLNIGADYLIIGSISEFGRRDTSDVGVFSRSKRQTVYAKVNIRLVNVKTGEIIFAQEGAGEAFSEAGTVMGLGNSAGYDSTLNDKAISNAISNVVDGIMVNLLNAPWRSYILSLDKSSVIIAGGIKQGLILNDIFYVFRQGEKIRSPQTGMFIELPGTKIAEIKVQNQFGSNYTDEGSICSIVSGSIKGENIEKLYIQKQQ